MSEDAQQRLKPILGARKSRDDKSKTASIMNVQNELETPNNRILNSTKSVEAIISKKGNTNNSTDKSRYLCARFDIGRLGNILFIYASAYGIATKTDLTFAIEKTNVLRDIFPNLKAKVISESSPICKTVYWKHERQPNTFDDSVYVFPNDRNIHLNAYLQSWYYFRNVMSDIRKQYKFKDEIMSNASQRLQAAINSLKFKGMVVNEAEIVGIHVRRGDKLGKQAIKEGHLVATREFYQRAINYFRKKLKNPIFVVVMSWHNSNDLKWARNNIIGNDTVMLGDGPVEADLCVLSICDHTIVSTGTFGWWGAWLCNGRTIYCKDYAVKGSEVDLYFSRDLKDYILPNWIGM